METYNNEKIEVTQLLEKSDSYIVTKIENGRWKKRLSILFENHNKNHFTFTEPRKEECTCSYCHGDSKIKYGLNIPKIKNGWWAIKYWKRRYIRFTITKVYIENK